MKFFKNAVKAASAAIMALLLVGCGEKQNKTTVGNDGNTAYQTAISNLETGDNKQAYSELKAVDEKKLSVKAQKLRNNLKYLLAAKKALTGNDVEEAEKNLANLDTAYRKRKNDTRLIAAACPSVQHIHLHFSFSSYCRWLLPVLL